MRRTSCYALALVAFMIALTPSCATNNRQLLARELRLLGYEVQEVEDGIVVFLPDVLFSFGSDELSTSGERKVEGVAELIERLSALDYISVEGHTDSIGSAEFNLDLSERRASAVSDLLIATGVSSERVVVKGFGETRPLQQMDTSDAPDTSNAHRLNRRVEVILKAPRE